MLHKPWKWVCRAVGPKLVVFLEHLTYHQNVASKSVLTRITLECSSTSIPWMSMWNISFIVQMHYGILALQSIFL